VVRPMRLQINALEDKSKTTVGQAAE
jgi:hypothetical protein